MRHLGGFDIDLIFLCDLDIIPKQLAGHMLVTHDTLFVIVHHLVHDQINNAYVGWPPF